MKETDLKAYPAFTELKEGYVDAVLDAKDVPSLTQRFATDVSLVTLDMAVGKNKNRTFRFLVKSGYFPAANIQRAYNYAKTLVAKEEALEAAAEGEIGSINP